MNVVYSIGVGDDVSFDMDLAARGKEIFLFDHTVDQPPLSHPNFHFFKCAVGGSNDVSHSIDTLEHQIETLGHAGRSDLLLKVDVEGDEFEIFSAISCERLKQFQQIVIEIHWLSRLSDASYRGKFIDILSKINHAFTLFTSTLTTVIRSVL